MNSPVDARGLRLTKLKQAQRQLSLLSAQAQQRAAVQRREEAAALRASAEQTLHLATLQPENGLTRSLLFDRLRVLAVARAHALETGHAASDREAAVVSMVSTPPPASSVTLSPATSTT